MKSQKGFTVFGFIIVMVILGIIVSIAIPAGIAARKTARGYSDFPMYFGVKLPDGNLDSAQKAVLKPFVEKRLKELSDISTRDRDALTDILKQPPAYDAAQAQDRLAAVTKAEEVAKASGHDYQRARFAAQLYGLSEQ